MLRVLHKYFNLEHDTHITRLLSDIVEKDFSNMTPYTDTITAVTGFPTAPHRGTQQNVIFD